MRIGLYHGYELVGSGSNEYTRYLSRSLARLGHEVHLFCREPHPERVEHVSRALAWDADGRSRELFARNLSTTCVVHQLPHGPVRPVYLDDQQRDGNVKAFTALTDAELDEYHRFAVATLRLALAHHPVDVLHANHLVYQSSVAVECGVPVTVFLHGSAIEYAVRPDARMKALARGALARAEGLIGGNQEVLDRVFKLFPEDRAALQRKSVIVGVGVDTAFFQPVERARRGTVLAPLAGEHGGKDPRLSIELTRRLDEGDFDALTGYHASYEHGRPDSDLAAKLARIPFEEGRVVLFVGALTAGKGLQGVIAAFPEVLRRHPDAHLVAVGAGAYREVLEALVHAFKTGNEPLFSHLVSCGFDLDGSELTGGWADVRGPLRFCPALGDHVHFLGRLDHALLRYVFPCADLSVFPSIVPEAYALVLMESLSNGVLPAVSDFSGFADGLRTLEGLLGTELVDRMRLPIEPEIRVAGIAARLGDLLADTEALAQGDRLRAIAVEHFDWDVQARQMVHAYKRLVSST